MRVDEFKLCCEENMNSQFVPGDCVSFDSTEFRDLKKWFLYQKLPGWRPSDDTQHITDGDVALVVCSLSDTSELYVIGQRGRGWVMARFITKRT
jgi:hypothetical protein